MCREAFWPSSQEGFSPRRQWRGRRLSANDLTCAGLELSGQLQDLVSGRFTDSANRWLANHVLDHAMHWFWFLIDPTIDATNRRAEQAICPAVVNRKVWGGNRTWAGACVQSTLTSLWVTLEQRGDQVVEWFSVARCARVPLPLP